MEWNQGKLYLGALEGKFLTYCKAPIGQIFKNRSFEIKETSKSFVLNLNDVQKIDKDFVVSTSKGRAIANRLVRESIDLKNITGQVRDYVNSKYFSL